jgi:hypothetical protein
VWAADSSALPVVYRPDRNDQFSLAGTGEAVFSASDVFMVPGQCKVWAKDVRTTAGDGLQLDGGQL